MARRLPRKWWNDHDDFQWSTSRTVKNGSKWFDQQASREWSWLLEVRSEYAEVGTVRYGEMFVRRNLDTGVMTLSITEDYIP